MASDTPLTLAALLTPPTAAEVKASLLLDLDALGFASTSWQEGQPELALVEAFSEIDSQRMIAVSTLVRWCFFRLLRDGEEDVAAEMAESFFGVTRHPSTFAERTVTLTNTAGSGPYNPLANEFALSGGGIVYRNVSGFSVPATVGATVSVLMRAEVAGAIGNIAALREFVTPLAGVSLTSQVITTVAQDAERLTDLRERCWDRWYTLPNTGELPPRGYAYVVKTDNPLIVRAKVRNDAPDGAGSFRVYIARNQSTATSGDVTAAQAAVDAVVPPCVTSNDVLAATVAAVTVSGTVLFSVGNDTTENRAAVEAAARAYAETLPIGGTLVFSELVSRMQGVAGVESVILSAPLADTTTGAYDVISLTWSVSYGVA
jgi:uncharacterized phage protein gp47/JayE